MKPIAILHTPFPDKFGIPRQSGLIPEAIGRVQFLPGFDRADFVRGLETFSHIWLITEFHANPPWDGTATVRPPRLGGNERLGVFATRSPNRPNPIGLSVVKLLEVQAAPHLALHVAGVDALDGTPVLDIKPYLPWCENIPDAEAGWAAQRPEQLPEDSIQFAAGVQESLGTDPGALRLVVKLLRLEPQPAYHDDPDRVYGLTAAGWNVRWQRRGDALQVIEATRV